MTTKSKGKTFEQVMAASPIRDAVAPLKADAMKRAAQYAQEQVITPMLAEMEAAGWDLNKAAPRPSQNMIRRQYMPLKMKHDLYARLTKVAHVPGQTPWYKPGAPEFRERAEEHEAAYIRESELSAGLQYDAFVMKLVAKVGECISAKLEGSHVWGFSFLTVEKLERLADGAQPINVREVWKTQCILNVSVLGKVFNQWPTRKVKS